MKLLSGKQFAALLERHGWELKRIHGSHHIYARQGSIARISVPIHANTLLKLGLQKHLARLAGIPDSELR